MTREEYFQALMKRHGEERQKKFLEACVGIAGLGGLGSNVAYFLARMGVGKLILVDFDRVEPSNLNRQQYRVSDLGSYKADALVRGLKEINPFCTYEAHREKVTPENAVRLLKGCKVVVEAFDRPEEKAMLLENVLQKMPGIPLVSGSGMAGYGSANEIHTRRVMGRVYLCGDEYSDMNDGTGLMAPRVALCAAHEATMVLRIILGEMEP